MSYKEIRDRILQEAKDRDFKIDIISYENGTFVYRLVDKNVGEVYYSSISFRDIKKVKREARRFIRKMRRVSFIAEPVKYLSDLYIGD